MNEYTENKLPKIAELYRLITRTISLDKKKSGLNFEDFANEIGLCSGTLRNKLKPSDTIHDLTLMEFINILGTTGDYSSLEFIASHFNKMVIDKNVSLCGAKRLNNLADEAIVDESDVFRTIKSALTDSIIDEQEKQQILKELDKADSTNASIRIALTGGINAKA